MTIPNLLKHASLRTKFTLLPLVASVFLIALAIVFLTEIGHEKKLLANIEHQTLTKIDRLLTLYAKLSSNHGDIFSLLASSAEQKDEELIYVKGKPKLYAIHQVEKEIEKIPRTFALRDGELGRLEVLEKRLREYKSEAISAIEMASVDLKIANTYMIKANHKFINASNNFLGLLEFSKADTLNTIKHSREEFIKKTAVVLGITVLGMGFLMVISIRTARTVSAQIKEQIELMSALASGNTAIEPKIPEGKDEIAELAQGVLAFKSAMIDAMKKEEAEKANHLKSMFLANMSHELRTPIHGILSFAKFGVKNVVKGEREKLRKYFETIRDSGTLLLALVNDLLDLAKLESGKMTMEFRNADLSMLLSRVVDEFQSMTWEKRIQFEFTSPDGEESVRVDPDKISQVLRNLMSNAVKFSPDNGSVRVSATKQDGCVVVAVTDEGIGIPPDEVESIFDKFVQSSKTRTAAGGTGLGLAICREIVQAHGGKIWAENRTEGGARVSFEIPWRHPISWST